MPVRTKQYSFHTNMFLAHYGMFTGLLTPRTPPPGSCSCNTLRLSLLWPVVAWQLSTLPKVQSGFFYWSASRSLRSICVWMSLWIWRDNNTWSALQLRPTLTLFCRFNTLRPRQHGRHFEDDIFRTIFVNEKCCILIKISLKFVSKGAIDNNPTLVWIMAWCRPGDKPLSESMMVNLLTHICVTRPQWVNILWLSGNL